MSFDWRPESKDRYFRKAEAAVKAAGFDDILQISREQFAITIIQTNITKEQISPKTSSFRGFLYIPINLSDTTKTHEISTVTNT